VIAYKSGNWNLSEDAPDLVFGRPILPPRDRLFDLIGQALDNKFLTNGGPLQQNLEQALQSQMGAKVCLVSSGTMALMMALQLGNLPAKAEVITPPLSFAASVQSITWCGFKPVFADVEPDYPTLCAQAVERAITPQTAAILAVHFQGLACDVPALEAVARKHGLWLVFDAAQTPDILRDGQNLCLAGDATAFSLHATKLLHSAEGGGVVTRNLAAAERLRLMRNFGLKDGRMADLGNNGKLSELHAAVALAVAPQIEVEMHFRQRLRRLYDEGLRDLTTIRTLRPRPGTTESALYYTLSMPSALQQRAVQSLRDQRIWARDHFPLLCGPGTYFDKARIVTLQDGASNAERLAPRYMSLPLNSEVSDMDALRIVQTLRACAKEYDETHDRI
jgi:dTDP-4-amino-4,6-dideoxygalactose transaminase